MLKARTSRIAKDRGSELEVRQLRALLTVLEHGSVSAAAAALGVAQSTVSETIAALDRAVGTATLQRRRGARSVELTEAGRALLPHARRILRELDAIAPAVARVTGAARATMRIGANESVSTYVLVSAVGALQERWSGLDVAIDIGTCAAVRDAVAAGRCELGVVLTAHAWEEEASDALTTTVLVPAIPLVVFARPDHPLAGPAATCSPQDRARFALYLADSAGDFHEMVRRYFADTGLPGPRLVSVGSVESVRRGVAADASTLGLLPAYALVEDLDAGRVTALDLRPPPPLMQLVVLLRASRTDPHPALVELLAALRRSDAGSAAPISDSDESHRHAR